MAERAVNCWKRSYLFLNITTFFISPFNSANFADPSARKRKRKRERECVCMCVSLLGYDTVIRSRRTQVSCPHHTHAHHTRYHVGRSIAGDVAVFDLLSPHCPFSHSPFYEGKKGKGRAAQRRGPWEGEGGQGRTSESDIPLDGRRERRRGRGREKSTTSLRKTTAFNGACTREMLSATKTALRTSLDHPPTK